MDSLIIDLTGALVANPAAPNGGTSVGINLSNSTGKLRIDDRDGEPRSIHRVKVRNAADFGYGVPHHLTVEQASRVLALSFSMANASVLFSPLQPQQYMASIEFGEIPSQINIGPDPSETAANVNVFAVDIIRAVDSCSTLLRTRLELDEGTIMDVANRLLVFRIFNGKDRSLLDHNILASLRSYQEAFMCAGSLSCYEALYIAFEKAVNADSNRQDKIFDGEACSRTGLSDSEIVCIREFHNRTKHVSRHEQDQMDWESGEAQLGPLVTIAKKAADRAILSRI